MTHTTERVRVHETRRPVPGPPQSPRQSPWLGWVVIAAGLFAAAVLILQAITSDTAPQPNDTEQAPVAPSRLGVPGSADGAERYLADYGAPRPMGVPGSADGAERYLAGYDAPRPMGVPGSADGAERYLAELRPR